MNIISNPDQAMDIYLIRHTTPAVDRGICYGQTDLDITDRFLEEAAIIRGCLPASIGAVYSSPLQRCAKLAAHLFPSHSIQLRDELMEINCGKWEMRSWDELPGEELDPWMKDFVQVRIPEGESYIDLNERVTRCFSGIRNGLEAGNSNPGAEITSAINPIKAVDPSEAVALFTHGGPIRSILASLTGTALADSFKAFSLHYGCVVKISGTGGVLPYEILSNPAPMEKEQHKPSKFYKK